MSSLPTKDSYDSFTIRADGLPVSAHLRSGERADWTYSEPLASTPPDLDMRQIQASEVYADVSLSEASETFGIDLPSTIDSYVVAKVFRHETTTGDGPAHYVIWRSPGGGTLQIVYNQNAHIDTELAGLDTSQGFAGYVAQEPSGVFQAAADDVAALTDLLRAVRPNYASDVKAQ